MDVPIYGGGVAFQVNDYEYYYVEDGHLYSNMKDSEIDLSNVQGKLKPKLEILLTLEKDIMALINKADKAAAQIGFD